MPTITPMLDQRGKSKYFPIVVYVYHQYQKRYIDTGFNIENKYWKNTEVVKHPDAAIINSRITSIVKDAKDYFAECLMKNRKPDLQLIGKQRKAYSFNDYLLHRAKQYFEKEMIIMDRKCRRFDKELRLYINKGLTIEELKESERKKKELPGAHVYFEDVTSDFLRGFDGWLIRQGNGANTRHKKFEFLGKFYTDAIDEEKAPSPNPFKKYKIGQKPVKKEKLSTQEITAIEKLKLKPGPTNDARNLFLFSYYCKGQRFETCITAKKDQVHDGRIHFQTNKGKKFLSVKIHARLQAIIDFYKKLPGEFIFPYLKEIPVNKKDYISVIGTWNAMVNRELKTVAKLAGIRIKLTFHISRHSFAWHLKQTSDNIHVIQDSLAHSRSSTTEMYLKSLDDHALDPEMEKLYGK